MPLENSYTHRQLHKFGGSSLHNAQALENIAFILEKHSQPNDFIVVSAMGKTTDLLIKWIETSSTDVQTANHSLQTLCHRYLLAANTLLNSPEAITHPFQQDILRLSTLLENKVTEATYAEILAHGEIWSARLLSAYGTQQGLNCEFIDARDFLCAERDFLPQINATESKAKLQQLLSQKEKGKRFIITGFICRNHLGETVLLGRNGSDYSATGIAALADIKQVVIWSDVAGVYTADPNWVKTANLLPLIRLDEADELARLGTPILHFRTLEPVKQHDLTLFLRSSLEPESGSTRIEHLLATATQGRVVTYHNHIGLIEMIVPPNCDIPSWQSEINQWITEQNIVPLAQEMNTVQRSLKLAYPVEFIDDIFIRFKAISQQMERMFIRYDLSLIAVVGAGVCQNSLQIMRFYQTLQTYPVEFFSLSPNHNSVVAILRSPVQRELLHELHNNLFKAHKTIGIVVLGKGDIAKTWIRLYLKEHEKLSARSQFDFTLIGLVSSQKAWLDYQGLSLAEKDSDIETLFEQHAETLAYPHLLQWLSLHPFDELVILDITASEEVAQHYYDYAKYGFHVLSANKRAAAFELDNYHRIANAFKQNNCHWLYNATVGGGLPINIIVNELLESGDTILSIEGTFSSCLSWLFYQYDGRIPFSQLIEQAWLQGLTERDPREDLFGLDALRKLLIIVRSAGYPLDSKQVKVQSLIPLQLADLPLGDFFEALKEHDEQIENYYQSAQDEKALLRYVARFDIKKGASIGLEWIYPDDPIAETLPGENLFLIKTQWYRDTPLVIHGPSAGKEMTAGLLQSDLNQLTKRL